MLSCCPLATEADNSIRINRFRVIFCGGSQLFSLVSIQVEPEKLKTLTHDLEALDRAAKRGLK